MKVVHIIKATRVAGAERHLMTLLPALKASGVDVTLLLIHEPGKPVDDFAPEGVTVVRVPIARHLDFGVIGRLQTALRQIKPDIAHTHLLHADIYGGIAAKLARVRRTVISRHNDDQFRTLIPMRIINNLLWRLASAGIAISESVRQFCIRVEGVKPEKIHTIHYGLSMPQVDRREARAKLSAELKLTPDAVILGSVCRLIAQKGLVYSLRAFARLDTPNAVMVIAGDGNLRGSLQAEARALGVAERVHFLGWREDTAQLMAAFDVFVAPSLWEGFGLVLLEAMAQQTPIIASNVSAIPEIVLHRETGKLVLPRDPAALTRAFNELIADSALRRHMGLVGQDRLETAFSVERMTEQTVALYERVMS